MISNIDPVELENVLRPTIYRPASSEPERSGADRLCADKAAPASNHDARLSASLSRLREALKKAD
ncbi:MAG TPA: hypothetical protein VH559_05760 [Gemmatimonadaceae bacterium]|jgi:hypothetical protein